MMINKPQKEKLFGLFIFSILWVRVSLFVFQVNDKGNAVIGTRYGRLNGMFGANEMSICKQDLILQEEFNCETSINVREAASQQSLSGGQGFFKCSCKSKSSSNRCKCKKNGVLCNSRCHSSGSCDNK